MTKNSRKTKLIIIRYLIATMGLLLVAYGIGISIISNLGTSPLSCPSYVMEGVWGLTVGNWTIIINMLYLVIQISLLRKNFKSAYLMQILATVVFGYMIDFSLWSLNWIHPSTIVERLILIIIACAVTAMGISIEVIAKAWMLSAEMTVFALTQVLHFKFSNIKIAMDSILVLISGLMAWLMFDNPFGSGQFTSLTDILLGNTEGVVIGTGTLLMALLCGGLMKFTDPIADKLMDKVIDRIIFNIQDEY